MNVFTTDHPMVREPSPTSLRWRKRLLRVSLIFSLGYAAYLLLLGPFCALGERGVLDSIPQPVLKTLMLPAAPVAMIPGLRDVYRDYLNRWYDEQNTTL